MIVIIIKPKEETMKKSLSLIISVFLLAGCSSGTAAVSSASADSVKEETKEEVQTVGEYTIYNMTGEGITELYLYPTGSSDKGTNYAEGGHGFANAHAVHLTYDAGDKASETALTLEFVTKSGYTKSFETLHIETADITLPAEDALTGSTPIAFSASKAEYTIYNRTGETITELYIYPTGTEDKGENLIKEAAEDGGTQVITFDKVPENLIKEDGSLNTFRIEFVTESGYTAGYETLSYEVAPITLISADAMTGATEIQFGAPKE